VGSKGSINSVGGVVWCGMGNQIEAGPSGTVTNPTEAWGQRRESTTQKVTIEYFTNVKAGETADVLVVAGQHPREWNSLLIAQTFLESLKREDLADVKLVVVPNANPAGLVRSKTVNRMQRGNARNVDLNRNFPTEHFQEKAPTQNMPWTNGDKDGSEPETLILMGLIKELQPKTVLNLHCFGRLIILPHSYTTELPPEWPVLHEHAELMRQVLKACMGHDYNILPFRKIYEGHGPLMEWCYSRGIACFTFEFGTSFERDDETVRRGKEALRKLIEIASAVPRLGAMRKATSKELKRWSDEERVNVPYQGYMHLQCIGMKRCAISR